jgi:transcriptional regulator with XRE-family HTH domain
MIDACILLARRTECGLSQRKLAKFAGVNAMTIKRIEDGGDASELPLAVLGRLADALDTEPAELLLLRGDTGAAAASASPPALDAAPLDHNAARLLRRIHRGDDIRRTMSRADREITLPSLVNRGLVEMTPNGAFLTPDVAASLTVPGPVSSDPLNEHIVSEALIANGPFCG